jgi:hypothetical protein
MRTFVVLGMASLALSLVTSSANAKGGEAGGTKTNNGAVATSCAGIVQARYCGGLCKSGSPAEAKAHAQLAVCIQNGGKL